MIHVSAPFEMEGLVMQTLRLLTLVFFFSSLSLGCLNSGSPSICEKATKYVVACKGQSNFALPTTCDDRAAISASQILQQSCEQLFSEENKNDGWDLSPLAENPACFPLWLLGYQVWEGGFCCWNSNCEKNLVCINWRCAEHAKEGEICDTNEDCVSGLACILGTCGPFRQLGEPCEDFSDCADNNVCGLGNICSKGAEGEPCEEHHHCSPQNVCGPNKTCVPYGAGTLGDPCAENLHCAYPNVCLPNNLCGPKQANEAMCTDNSQCENTCIAGACANRSHQGEPCDANDGTDCEYMLFLSCVSGGNSVGTCEKPQEGDPCDPNAIHAQCPSELICWSDYGPYATTGTCTQPRKAGETCYIMFDCEKNPETGHRELFCIFEKDSEIGICKDPFADW